jgi:hypothetical protein
VLEESGECPKRNPQGGSLFLRESKREIKRGGLGRVGEEKELPASFTARDLGPIRARHARTVRPRGRSARCADDPAPQHGWSVICSRTSSIAPLPLELRGWSRPPWRTVLQEWPDSPAHCHGQSYLPLHFQLDIFRDKDLKKYLLGSLLKNNEGNLSCDAIYQSNLGNYAKASFKRIRGQKHKTG